MLWRYIARVAALVVSSPLWLPAIVLTVVVFLLACAVALPMTLIGSGISGEWTWPWDWIDQ